MRQTALTTLTALCAAQRLSSIKYFSIFIAGLLATLGFAPFHLPGFTLLSLAFFYSHLLRCSRKESMYLGFLFGLGYFGFGTSWVIVSIHDYGQLNYFLSGLATLIFVAGFALYPFSLAFCFKSLEPKGKKWLSIVLFAALWCSSEFLRANLFTGFPWLLVGTTLIDTPIKYLTPFIGVYGLSLFCVFLAGILQLLFQEQTAKRTPYVILFILLIISPYACKNIKQTQIEQTPISIGAIQLNLSMRDKWDETLFWSLLNNYEKGIKQLLGNKLIILPESALPLPANYLDKYLQKLNDIALQNKSAVMVGTLQSVDEQEKSYYNSVITLGAGEGIKLKQHLVPFGEYIPQAFSFVAQLINFPDSTLIPGAMPQQLINIANHPIASLICYEIAYPSILRAQMPNAQWIVSISDNGWFGHTFASFQQLQMAQVLSLLTGRYQVVANNDGLSSIINHQGEIVESLPPFSAGVLQGNIFPATGTTLWILIGEYPALIFCLLVFIAVLRQRFFAR